MEDSVFHSSKNTQASKDDFEVNAGTNFIAPFASHPLPPKQRRSSSLLKSLLPPTSHHRSLWPHAHEELCEGLTSRFASRFELHVSNPTGAGQRESGGPFQAMGPVKELCFFVYPRLSHEAYRENSLTRAKKTGCCSFMGNPGLVLAACSRQICLSGRTLRTGANAFECQQACTSAGFGGAGLAGLEGRAMPSSEEK